jgi:hypothetical protein
MIHIVCLKWGNKYSPEYVNKLYGMVKRNTTVPFVFHCMTEQSLGVAPEINVLPLPNMGLHGWWYKLYLFNNNFYGLSGEILFLDLDIVITGSLDEIVTYAPGRFCIASDGRPGAYNSSVMRFNIGSMDFVWNSFIFQQEKIVADFHGDQDWIQHQVLTADIYPFPLVVSYKFDCNARAKFGGGLLGKWLRTKGLFMPSGEAIYPKDARIILFHGKPDPEDVMHRPYDKYRRAPWIASYWKE